MEHIFTKACKAQLWFHGSFFYYIYKENIVSSGQYDMIPSVDLTFALSDITVCVVRTDAMSLLICDRSFSGHTFALYELREVFLPPPSHLESKL